MKFQLLKQKISKNKYTWLHKCLSKWQFIVFQHNKFHIGGYYVETHPSQSLKNNQQICVSTTVAINEKISPPWPKLLGLPRYEDLLHTSAVISKTISEQRGKLHQDYQPSEPKQRYQYIWP